MKESEKYTENDLLTKLQRLECFINNISNAIAFLDLNGFFCNIWDAKKSD